MPQAVTHVILTIILIDIYRHYFAKKKFPRWYLLVGGIAGLLPDIDMPIGWAYNWVFGTSYNFHGGITHIFLIPICIAFLAFLVYKIKDKKLGFLMGLIAFGWAFHIFLDFIVLAAYMPFWPFYTQSLFSPLMDPTQMAGLDAVLLLLWLVHEEVAHKIRDYI
jgi:membrane-bound metal-dependent hydrolase YbcI (DUF457 family)